MIAIIFGSQIDLIAAAGCTSFRKEGDRREAVVEDFLPDVPHMSRPYANSVLTQKQVIKYGKMTKDSFGYVFSAMGSVNGEEKLWRLGINTAKGLVWHWGHGF